MLPEEKNRHRKGMIISLGIHAAILILFVFLLAWSPPDPPIEEFGIELNFGMQEMGSGDVETEEVSESDSEQESENPNESESVEETVEEVVEEQADVPSEEITEESSDIDYDDAESPDQITDTEVKEVVKEETTTETKQIDEPKEDPKPLVTYPKGGGKTGEGDDDEKGNKGDPRGKDGVAYSGSPGSGGASLEMAGWKWNNKPVPDDPTDATGKIIFQIEVDEYGTVVGIKTLEKTVSPLVEKIYKDEVLKTSFSKTSGAAAAKRSFGKITFVIRSN